MKKLRWRLPRFCCWRAPLRRPSTISSMAGRPSGSIPIAVRSPFPASTTIPARNRSRRRPARGQERSGPAACGCASAGNRARAAAAPAAPAPAAAPPPAAPPPAPTTAATAPADTGAAPLPPPVLHDPAPPPPPPPAEAAVPPPAPVPAAPAPAAGSGGRGRASCSRPCRGAASIANSPLGVWLTEEKEGKVRIEQCGANLCGYSVDAKSNQNGEQVLINMRPGKPSQMERPDPRSEHRQHL